MSFTFWILPHLQWYLFHTLISRVIQISGAGYSPVRPHPELLLYDDYWVPAGLVIFSITWSRLKLAAFMRGGYSLKVARKFPT